jgi:hypothetical protein
VVNILTVNNGHGFYLVICGRSSRTRANAHEIQLKTPFNENIYLRAKYQEQAYGR